MTNMIGRNETAYLGCEAILHVTTPLKFCNLPETKKPGEHAFAYVSEGLLSLILF
jgi:hypothetical protein